MVVPFAIAQVMLAERSRYPVEGEGIGVSSFLLGRTRQEKIELTPIRHPIEERLQANEAVTGYHEQGNFWGNDRHGYRRFADRS